MTNKNSLWVEKYRPTTLEDYIFHDGNQKAMVENIIAQGMIPHLLLCGVQGTGKTTLANIFITETGVDATDVLKLNASKENSIEVIREKITNFITAYAFGKYKVVYFEEAERLTIAAQEALRSDMEEYADTCRFIFTCNHDNKLTPAMKSRCQQFRFKTPCKEDAVEFVAKILIAEKVSFTIELLDRYVDVAYPDIRQIIHLLQQHTVKGKLLDVKNQAEETADYRFQLLDAVEAGDWQTARKITCGTVAPEEWEDIYRFLYQNLNKCKTFAKQDKWDEAIIIIADHLQKHAYVADPEINAAAMFIRLGRI